MSYILEALRKADAERQRDRGSVPDLHAQQIPRTAAGSGGAPPATPIGWWIGLAVAAALFALLAWAGWLLFGSKPTVADAARTAPALAGEPASASMAKALPKPLAVPEAAASTVSPAAATSVPPALPAAAVPAASPTPTPTTALAPASRPAAMPATVARPEPKALPRPPTRADATQRPAKAGVSAASAPTLPVVAGAAASSAETRVPGLAELPEDVRRQVPAMTMGGSVYSPEPARRMVIVNGQVFVEGSTLAPELTLERINPKSAVFSIRGQLFLVPL